MNLIMFLVVIFSTRGPLVLQMAAKRLPGTEWLKDVSQEYCNTDFKDQWSDLQSVDPTMDANEDLFTPGGGWDTSAPTMIVGSLPKSGWWSFSK